MPEIEAAHRPLRCPQLAALGALPSSRVHGGHSSRARSGLDRDALGIVSVLYRNAPNGTGGPWRAVWNRPRIVHGLYRNDARCSEYLAKSAFRYILRHLATRPPDLGSGGATRGGSSPSSSTEYTLRQGATRRSLGDLCLLCELPLVREIEFVQPSFDVGVVEVVADRG